MVDSFEELSEEMRELKANIRSSSKDMDLKDVASWVSKLVNMNERLCERLELLSREVEELESALSAEESAKIKAKKKEKTAAKTAEPKKKKGLLESLFGD